MNHMDVVYMTVQEYAAYRRAAGVTVLQWLAKGIIRRAANGRIEVARADAMLSEHQQKAPHTTYDLPPDPPPVTLDELMARRPACGLRKPAPRPRSKKQGKLRVTRDPRYLPGAAVTEYERDDLTWINPQGGDWDNQ